MGRFITENPIKDGMNWYVYCGNNPLRYVDKTGLLTWDYDVGLDDMCVGDYNLEHTLGGGGAVWINPVGTGMPSTQMMGSGLGLFSTLLSPLIDFFNKMFSKSGKSVPEPETATDGAGALKGDGNIKNGINSADTAELTKNIYKTATKSDDYGLTKVGRAFQKHAGRGDRGLNIWGEIKGGNSGLNKAGLQHLNEIIKGPGDFIKNGKYLEKFLPDGRGVRILPDGTFNTFLD